MNTIEIEILIYQWTEHTRENVRIPPHLYQRMVATFANVPEVLQEHCGETKNISQIPTVDWMGACC